VSDIAHAGRAGIFFTAGITSGVSLFTVSGAVETDGLVSTGAVFRLATTGFRLAFFADFDVALRAWVSDFVSDFVSSFAADLGVAPGIDGTAAGRET
jgi:hypothetical protein